MIIIYNNSNYTRNNCNNNNTAIWAGSVAIDPSSLLSPAHAHLHAQTSQVEVKSVPEHVTDHFSRMVAITCPTERDAFM